MAQSNRKPGDDILDRYVPHLSGSDREVARERLQKLARLRVHIAMRQVREEREAADSRGSVSRGKIPPNPPVDP